MVVRVYGKVDTSWEVGWVGQRKLGLRKVYTNGEGAMLADGCNWPVDGLDHWFKAIERIEIRQHCVIDE